MERGITLGRTLNWVRLAYPTGIPAGHYVPLLSVLHRWLTPDEITSISEELAGLGAPSGRRLAGSHVASMVTMRTHLTALAPQLADVSAKLAAAGWPLADPALEPAALRPVEGPPRAITRALTGVVSWLRAGYPDGVPELDYIPLVAVLQRRLTKEEMVELTEQLAASGHLAPDRADIGVAISKLTQALPNERDIERVTKHLRAQGWPVELAE